MAKKLVNKETGEQVKVLMAAGDRVMVQTTGTGRVDTVDVTKLVVEED